ncbi:hypothetical protein [Chryseobacterium sp. WLY505]|uniref:hypothetical protein n=1 Tax=Chryseobacterium sp. WLY505 TaxID=3068892 RepID=UPI002796867A|nr:hypothetical protein [Chryseobacterium sp. WLY505]MDQ1855738.1 hypothetical protein [Chryseobacterium sp. WLY505]
MNIKHLRHMLKINKYDLSIKKLYYIYTSIMARIISKEPVKESIRIKNSRVELRIMVSSGKDGEYFVFISPTLLVTGYGHTEKEALNSFTHNLDNFCEDILSLSSARANYYLNTLGFKKERLRNKNYSGTFVDKNNVTADFEPESLKSQMLELAY